MESAAAGLALPGVSPFRPGDDFRRWIKGVERYLVAMNIKGADRRCAVVLHLLGPDIADTYETLPEPDTTEQQDAFDKCKAKLDAIPRAGPQRYRRTGGVPSDADGGK